MVELTQPVRGILQYSPQGILFQKFGENFLPIYEQLGLKGHSGIDLGTYRGDLIYAAHHGIVVEARDTESIAGKRITIVGDMLNDQAPATLYGHLERIAVDVGDEVFEGDPIGTMGNSGSEYYYMGVHLHFGLFLYSTPKAGTYQKTFGDKTYTVLNFNNGYRGAIDPLPYLTNTMRYVIHDKEQYLLEEGLMIALNIGDEKELARLITRGLEGRPESISKKELDKYLIYPLVEKQRLGDIFGL